VAREEKEKIVKRKAVISSKKAADPEDPEKKLYQNFMFETQSERPTSVQETSRLVHIEGEVLPNGLIKKTLAPTQQKIYLKRTKYIETEDGPREYVDIVTDPDQVKQILEKHKRLRIGGNKSINLFSMGEGDDQKRLAMKKEKRKIQEKQRRQKKNIAMRKELQERYKQGSRDGQLPGANVTLQCGRCGMHGHMKTNKSCPVYVGDEDDDGKSEAVLAQVPSILLSRGGARGSDRTTRPKREPSNKRKRGNREDDYEDDFLDDEVDDYYL
jgi:transcription initiation factor TFIID subunit 1